MITTDQIAEAALALRSLYGDLAIPVPVYDIARKAVTIFEERDLDRGRDGMAIDANGRMAIVVNRSITSAGRKRFTVGHELGHVRLHRGEFRCLSRDIGTTTSRDPKEQQANAFSSDLLMPEREFRAALGRDAPSLEAIDELSHPHKFHTSTVAAALRTVRLTDHQCMLVVSRDGGVEWTAASSSFGLYSRIGRRVPSGSVTDRATSAAKGTLLYDEEDATAWLDDWRLQSDDLSLEEEAMSLGGGRVITLLCPPEDFDPDDLADPE